jgi:hypothetical protein
MSLGPGLRLSACPGAWGPAPWWRHLDISTAMCHRPCVIQTHFTVHVAVLVDPLGSRRAGFVFSPP